MKIEIDDTEKEILHNLIKNDLEHECEGLNKLVEEFIAEISPFRDNARDYVLSFCHATANRKMGQMRGLCGLLDKLKEEEKNE